MSRQVDLDPIVMQTLVINTSHVMNAVIEKNLDTGHMGFDSTMRKEQVRCRSIEEIMNPYFGNKMLKCRMIQETIN